MAMHIAVNLQPGISTLECDVEEKVHWFTISPNVQYEPLHYLCACGKTVVEFRGFAILEGK